MSSSELSDLSSPLSTDDGDVDSILPTGKTLDHYFKNAQTPKSPPQPKRKRPLSPTHEYVLADNPDIAFLCMFRSRFTEAFPKSLPHYGPQDIENGVAANVPGEHVERLLCALLGLVLNRKKDIERSHYTRALEEAVQTHSGQWSPKWAGKNPLHGGGSFNNMSPEQRLTLMSTLVIWSLGSSEAVQDIIKTMYKQQRQNDDRNQPLSVQPWGNDGDKRRYWLIEGRDDTPFRLYRESNPALKHVTWRSVAGSIEELRLVATKLDEDGSQASRRLRDSIRAAIPRFEAGEDKRKRREYRMARKAQFTRPDPGFSLYEGRTRGKRIKYTFSDDDEDGGSDALSTKRPDRHSEISTPPESVRPTVTASGRQVRSRHARAFGQHAQGQALAVGGVDGTEEEKDALDTDMHSGRPSRNRAQKIRQRGGENESTEGLDSESDVTSSGHEWDGGDDDEADDHVDDGDDEEMDDDVSSDELEPQPPRTLVVSLRYSQKTISSAAAPPEALDDTVKANGLSDQAPPPEANPFAPPFQPHTARPRLDNGLPSTTNDITSANGGHHLHPPTMPSSNVDDLMSLGESAHEL